MASKTPVTKIDDDKERRRIVNRLSRLEGQIRGIRSMIESEKDCEAVLTQVMAAKSALNQVGMHVIGYAMKSCLVDPTLTDRNAIISTAFGVYLHYRDLGSVAEHAPLRGPATPADVVKLLDRLETEVRAVQEVMADAGDCEDALRRLTAATTTLNDVGLAVLGHAMLRCMIDESVSSREELIDQAVGVFLRHSSCVS